MRLSGPIAPIMKTHPLTGKPIVPVGFIGGRAVYPICGGAPDEDDDDDKDKDKDDTDSGGGGNDGGDDQDKDKDKDAGSDGDDLAARLEATERRMRAADKRATEAEKALKKREDAEKDELTKATDRVAELEKEHETLQSTVKSLRLQNAFLTANKHAWHDADEALASAERNGYMEDVVDEDGNVDKTKLAKALDRLAKDKEFLVKKAKADDDGDGTPSGQSAGGRSDNAKDEKAKQAQLKRRFPALNR